MHWLAQVCDSLAVPKGETYTICIQQPAWAKSREFEITTRSLTRGGVTSRTAGDIEDEDEDEDLVGNSKKKRRVSFMPSLGMSDSNSVCSGETIQIQIQRTPFTIMATGLEFVPFSSGVPGVD